ncbi:hypothetical protein [Vibrio sp. 10N.261.51.E5]|uniref:hypothetical protein n=1 Tax=unclassified Vibrio TaxID=2614977 RepID=UPI003550ADAF
MSHIKPHLEHNDGQHKDNQSGLIQYHEYFAGDLPAGQRQQDGQWIVDYHEKAPKLTYWVSKMSSLSIRTSAIPKA